MRICRGVFVFVVFLFRVESSFLLSCFFAETRREGQRRGESEGVGKRTARERRGRKKESEREKEGDEDSERKKNEDYL